jgi:hypothetical protein
MGSCDGANRTLQAMSVDDAQTAAIRTNERGDNPKTSGVLSV